MSLIFVISCAIIFIVIFIVFKRVKHLTVAIFPNYFKIFGIIILLICIFSSYIFKTIIFDKFRYLSITTGLTLICLSKEKDEDEKYDGKRFVSLFVSLITVMIIYQFSLIFDWFSAKVISSSEIFISILISYLLVFHWSKDRLKST
jgi:hypothetical protein